jgi:hypothetical protein
LSSPFRPLFLFPMLRLPGPGPLKYTILSHGSGSEPGHACISYMRASATCEPLLRYFPPAYSTAASLACCLCMPLYASVCLCMTAWLASLVFESCHGLCPRSAPEQ